MEGAPFLAYGPILIFIQVKKVESQYSVHVVTSLEKPKINLTKQIQTLKKALVYQGRSVVEECVTE